MTGIKKRRFSHRFLAPQHLQYSRTESTASMKIRQQAAKSEGCIIRPARNSYKRRIVMKTDFWYLKSTERKAESNVHLTLKTQ